MQATSIWLLALVKRCPRRIEMKERLLRVQRAFMALLAEGETFKFSLKLVKKKESSFFLDMDDDDDDDDGDDNDDW